MIEDIPPIDDEWWMDLEPTPDPGPLNPFEAFAALGAGVSAAGTAFARALTSLFGSGSGRVVITSPMRSGKTAVSKDATDALAYALSGLTERSSHCATAIGATMQTVEEKMEKKRISQGLVRNQGPRQRTFQKRGMR
jgi:hypothetical protein